MNEREIAMGLEYAVAVRLLIAAGASGKPAPHGEYIVLELLDQLKPM